MWRRSSKTAGDLMERAVVVNAGTLADIRAATRTDSDRPTERLSMRGVGLPQRFLARNRALVRTV